MTSGSGAPAGVLEDPTGRRALWLKRAGRVVFVVFLLWLIAMVLSGLGLSPIGGIPLGHALRPSAGPPELVRLPEPKQPPASDLAAAQPDPSLAAKVLPVPGGAVGAGRSATAPGKTKTTPTTTTPHGRSATAPGKTKTTPTTTTPHGRSATAPGKTKPAPTTTTPRGRSATAPKQPKKP